MFLERGDYLITEEFAFSSAVETALPMGVKMVGVKLDEEGLIPESMDEILSNWDEKVRGARKPFLLYTVPYVIHTLRRMKPCLSDNQEITNLICCGLQIWPKPNRSHSGNRAS